MRTIENRCKMAICPPDPPRRCLTCPEWNATVVRCDQCGEEAVYHCDGADWCEACLRKAFVDLFAQQSVEDMAEMLDIGTPWELNRS